jgi:hypothetical protein
VTLQIGGSGGITYLTHVAIDCLFVCLNLDSELYVHSFSVGAKFIRAPDRNLAGTFTSIVRTHF